MAEKNNYFRVKHTKLGEKFHEGDVITLDEIREIRANPRRLLRLDAIEGLYDDEGKDLYQAQGGTKLTEDPDPDDIDDYPYPSNPRSWFGPSGPGASSSESESEQDNGSGDEDEETDDAPLIDSPRGPVKPLAQAKPAETPSAPAEPVQTPNSATGSATEPGPGDMPQASAADKAVAETDPTQAQTSGTSTASAEPTDGYESKNVEELRAVASMLGVEKASSLSKKDLIAAIRKAEG